MKLNLLNIGINGASFDEVKDLLIHMDIYQKLNSIKEIFKVNIELEDSTEAGILAKDFLKDNDILDDNPFFNEFDITSYGLGINFYVMTNFKYMNFLDHWFLFLHKNYRKN